MDEKKSIKRKELNETAETVSEYPGSRERQNNEMSHPRFSMKRGTEAKTIFRKNMGRCCSEGSGIKLQI